MSAVIDVGKLTAELAEATTAYTDLKRDEDRARSATTDALNRVNKAQQALDAAIKDLKAHAPYGTDWQSARAQREYDSMQRPAGVPV